MIAAIAILAVALFAAIMVAASLYVRLPAEPPPAPPFEPPAGGPNQPSPYPSRDLRIRYLDERGRYLGEEMVTRSMRKPTRTNEWGHFVAEQLLPSGVWIYRRVGKPRT